MSDTPRLDPTFIPPHDLQITFGGGDFVKMGRRLLTLLIETVGLQPHHRVLDVGCGAGRLAAALTTYLNDSGSYEGFDTYPFGVDWAGETITPKRPNFRFQHLNIYNATYNPFGQVKAGELEFPFEDDSFDVVVLNSVFTHMLPEDVVNYLSQIKRTLVPGGAAFLTWFLVDDVAQQAMQTGKAEPRLPHRLGGMFVDDPASLEDAIGFREDLALSMIDGSGLSIESLLRGSWCGRQSSHPQDIVIARKTIDG